MSGVCAIEGNVYIEEGYIYSEVEICGVILGH